MGPEQGTGFLHPRPRGFGEKVHPPPAEGDAPCRFPPGEDRQSLPPTCINSPGAAHKGRATSLLLNRTTLEIGRQTGEDTLHHALGTSGQLGAAAACALCPSAQFVHKEGMIGTWGFGSCTSCPAPKP